MLRFVCFLLGKSYEPCKSCEILKEQNHILQEQNANLLHTIITLSKPESKVIEKMEMPEPITPKYTPWSVTRKSLEDKDREIFRSRMNKENPEMVKEIDKLEKELEIDNASEKSGTI